LPVPVWWSKCFVHFFFTHLSVFNSFFFVSCSFLFVNKISFAVFFPNQIAKALIRIWSNGCRRFIRWVASHFRIWGSWKLLFWAEYLLFNRKPREISTSNFPKENKTFLFVSITLFPFHEQSHHILYCIRFSMNFFLICIFFLW